VDIASRSWVDGAIALKASAGASRNTTRFSRSFAKKAHEASGRIDDNKRLFINNRDT
jgi:hypothetical protein